MRRRRSEGRELVRKMKMSEDEIGKLEREKKDTEMTN